MSESELLVHLNAKRVPVNRVVFTKADLSLQENSIVNSLKDCKSLDDVCKVVDMMLLYISMNNSVMGLGDC